MFQQLPLRLFSLADQHVTVRVVNSKIAQDDEFALYSVTIFRRVRDDFMQKCREEKFAVREYHYDEALIEKQRQEMYELEASEKDLWVSPDLSYIHIQM